MLWLITFSPVTDRQCAMLRHSKHVKPHCFPHKFLSHFAILFFSNFQPAFKSGSFLLRLLYFPRYHKNHIVLQPVTGNSCNSSLSIVFLRSCWASVVGTSVPECAVFRVSFSLSWLRFKLHFPVPDLKVAVVLMRGTLDISGPTGRRSKGTKTCCKPKKNLYVDLSINQMKTKDACVVIEMSLYYVCNCGEIEAVCDGVYLPKQYKPLSFFCASAKQGRGIPQVTV